MNRAETNICRARNFIPIIVPINTIPPEILARIFQLVVRSQHCHYQSKNSYSLKCPDVLSHVCSRWYQIAVGLPGLWSHIDLVPSHTLDGLLVRGNMFAARAGSLALGIDIVVQRPHDPDNKLGAFFASISRRLGSLEMIVHHGRQRSHLWILEACFSNCVPGTLNHLNLKGHFAESSSNYYCFIKAGNPGSVNSQVLHMHNWQFEDALLHVKTLHLRGTYFCWNSPAYHGLVELTLLPQTWFRFPSVDESQLMGILAASPMLREFTFGIGITNVTEESPSSPIVLNELECMSLCFMSNSQRKALIRMISPGPKPLRVALIFRKVFPPDHDEEFDMFLARANVTKLSIRIKSYQNGGKIPYLPKLLRLSPSLRNLSFYGYSCGLSNHCGFPDMDRDRSNPSLAGLHLNNLSLFYCDVDLTQLQQMAEIIPIQTLRLAQNCRFIDRVISPMQAKRASELSKMFPASVVELVGEDFSDNLDVDD